MSQAIAVRSPFDGHHIADVPTSTEADLEKALSTAHALFRDRKRWLSKEQRLAILRKAAAIIGQRREEIARQAASEGGKPFRDSLIEVDRGIDCLHICVEELRTNAGSVIPMDLNATSAARVAFTQREPIGVVLGISAFNHPFNLVVHQVAPAIAVGAPVIIKPSQKTPLSCLAVLNAFYEAGLPGEWAQMVLPIENELIGRLVSDARVGFLSFIGSAAVGWRLRSMLAPGTRCALEHGGVAPIIVAADANLEEALPRLARGGFWHAGQACVSVQRVYADSRIAKQVAEGIADIGNRLVIGDPVQATTDVGPLITTSERDRIHGWVHEAVAEGAQLVVGGKPVLDTCYANTVLLNPSNESKVTTKEVFAPVINVYEFDSIDSAIERANNSPFAFQSAVFTRDLETAMHCYRNLDGSAVMVNENSLFRVDWMPFAGARQSGHGVGGIPYTMHEMQTEKMMVWRADALK
ncbi:aldehyde dehydrogenase family protein [Paraburkholderia hospita]|uniref:aldehyde dehydrogenase family protein n=1 Tax=Paraburkholderia hospita TaxID=169430 RepID=UPI0002719350|nr:aldehyde dehydrogenase family protein [Paraburkholderia hospita]EUC20685.1 Lactaldehyde dehydrogenase [Burkholderia sp. BT03]SKC45315.1 Acyl-CoA reductase [Paraburkholderia hospita]